MQLVDLFDSLWGNSVVDAPDLTLESLGLSFIECREPRASAPDYLCLIIENQLIIIMCLNLLGSRVSSKSFH